MVTIGNEIVTNDIVDIHKELREFTQFISSTLVNGEWTTLSSLYLLIVQIVREIKTLVN